MHPKDTPNKKSPCKCSVIGQRHWSRHNHKSRPSRMGKHWSDPRHFRTFRCIRCEIFPGQIEVCRIGVEQKDVFVCGHLLSAKEWRRQIVYDTLKWTVAKVAPTQGSRPNFIGKSAACLAFSMCINPIESSAWTAWDDSCVPLHSKHTRR